MKGGITIPRVPRKNLQTNFLHVMVQGVNKEFIFNTEEAIKEYLRIVRKNQGEYKIEIMAYCMMNNHAHFLIYTEDIEEIGKFMHKTNLLFAQKYNDDNNRVGVLFRNRYRSEAIFHNKYLINCIKYIHENPVKARIVEKCEDYPYSSYRDYMNNTGVTKCEIMQVLFGRNCDYSELFESAKERRFIDVESDRNMLVGEYIESGILEFQKNHAKELSEVLSDRSIFKSMIGFLKDECGIKYIELSNYFGISKSVMEALKIH